MDESTKMYGRVITCYECRLEVAIKILSPAGDFQTDTVLFKFRCPVCKGIIHTHLNSMPIPSDKPSRN